MLDIRGCLKNTKVSADKYVVIQELLSNAIDSYLYRSDKDDSVDGLKVSIKINFFKTDFLNGGVDLEVICEDNGAGLEDEQVEAFVTKDTSYKDDLEIPGIGWCKGSGRVQYFHFFQKLKIESIFSSEDGKLHKRLVNINENSKRVSEADFITEDISQGKLQTIISLQGIRSEVRVKHFRDENLKETFSAKSLRQYVLVHFLHRLVSLRNPLGNFLIEFCQNDEGVESRESLTVSDLPELADEVHVKVFYKNKDGELTTRSEELSISQYKISKNDLRLNRNIVALCAKSSIVKIITSQYLKSKTLEGRDINGDFHIILVSGNFLDVNVSNERDEFDIPESNSADMLSIESISMLDIYEAIGDSILKMLEPPDWDRGEIVKSVGVKYGISEAMINDVSVRIGFGDVEDDVAKRVLKRYQEKIVDDTSTIQELKDELITLSPSSDDFREKMNLLAWRFTATLKRVDMANLSQVVVRRSAILTVLQWAIKGELEIQANIGLNRNQNERILHSIFFPMGKDSSDENDHDIWLLSEEYQYYEYIASDKPLSSYRWHDGDKLFEDDIDDELIKVLERNYDDNKLKRPDIAIFGKEGSVIIIEFKAPEVSMEDHLGDLMEYSRLLASKSKGRLKQFYGYLIGDTVNLNRIPGGYKRLANGMGWFDTQEIIEHETEARLGQLYSEMLKYDHVVKRALQRLEIYKSKLNLKIE